jgi:hypothetical protein
VDANRIRVRDGSEDDFIRVALGLRGARWSTLGRWSFSPQARPCAGRDGTRHTRAGSLPGRPGGIRSATSNGRPGLRHRHRDDSRGMRSRMPGTGRAGAADIQGSGIGRWCRRHCIGPVVGREGPREINLAPHRGGRLRSSNPHKRSRGCETVRHKDLIFADRAAPACGNDLCPARCTSQTVCSLPHNETGHPISIRRLSYSRLILREL